MGFLKDKLKYFAGKLGYLVTKKPTEASELLDFCYKNGWLKDFGIKTILDIGANEGQFAKKISALFPDTRLLCFEPLEAPFKLLKQNISFNRNASFYNYALGEADEELTINVNEFSPASSFLDLDDEHKSNFDYAVATDKNIVEVKRLDNLQLDIEEPFLVKIDVQGFEGKVIAGGLQTLKKAAVIIVETSFKPLYVEQSLFDDVYKVLLNAGFRYHGNFDQLLSPHTNEILQADAIFINASPKPSPPLESFGQRGGLNQYF
jgi:FkbM family methyltransferase